MTNNPPQVSVTIIFLNEEKYLQESIESVLAQTYDGWELLLVDDGSTDDSTDIARQYAKRNPEKIRYLEHDGHANRGMSASRNLGIAHSRGKYVARLDADDVLFPHALKEQVELMESHPRAGMTYAPIQMWHSWTGDPEDAARDGVQKLSVRPDTLIEPPDVLTLFLRDEGDEPCGMMVRRDVIESVGGYEEAVMNLYEDIALSVKVCLDHPVVTSAEPLYKYRQHPKSYCSVAKEKGEYDSGRLSFLNWVKDYLSERGVRDAGVWQALDAALSQQHQMLRRQRHPALYRLEELPRKLARRALPPAARRWLRGHS